MAGIAIYARSKPSSTTSRPQPTALTNFQQTKTFHSSNVMKFSISVPASYNVIEKLGAVTISTPNGKIYIDRNGTNFDNLEDYLEDLNQKNKTILSQKLNLKIDDLIVISGIIDKRKIYFIYKNYFVYTLSTDSEALFDDLDQIAQSFNYIP